VSPLDEEWPGSSSSRSCLSFTRSSLSQQILSSNPFTLQSLSLSIIPQTSFPVVAPLSSSVNFRDDPILLVRTPCCPRTSINTPSYSVHTCGYSCRSTIKLRGKTPKSSAVVERNRKLSDAVPSSFLLLPRLTSTFSSSILTPLDPIRPLRCPLSQAI